LPVQIPASATGRKQLLIDGKWQDAVSGKTFETRNPATGELLATVAEGDAADIDLAVAAARRAFEGPWSRARPYDRQRILLKFADLVEQHIEELLTLDSLDMGGVLAMALGGRQRIPSMIRYYAGMAQTLTGDTIPNSSAMELFSYTAREPVGVVGAIIPWNGPIGMAIWKLGPVLATGCTAVFKPAEETPLTALRLGELLLEAGLPEGVVNIVPGYGETAGAALAAHMDVDKLTFTGSHLTGQKIVQASAGNLKRLSLELGGKSPDIVFADADLDMAVPGAAMAAFANAGQVCTAGTRLFVERKIFGEFTQRVAEFGNGLKIGNGQDPDTKIGPLVSQRQLDRVTGYMEIGKKEGARAISGGYRVTDGELAKGFFVKPTVFTDVHAGMRIAREEIFGPVLAAMPFDDIDEVIRGANATQFGLGSGVWTRDVGKAHRMAKAIRAGVVWVNCYNVADPAVPFGGYKMSGYGRESGRQQFDDYLNEKSVWIRTA